MSTYFQAWPTPTPLPTPNSISTTPVFTAVEGVGPDLAEWIVQGYQAADYAGVIDYLMLVVYALIIIGGILSIIRHVQQL